MGIQNVALSQNNPTSFHGRIRQWYDNLWISAAVYYPLLILSLFVCSGLLLLLFHKFENPLWPPILFVLTVISLAEIVIDFPSSKKPGVRKGTQFGQSIKNQMELLSLGQKGDKFRCVTGDLRDFGLAIRIVENGIEDKDIQKYQISDLERGEIVKNCQSFIGILKSLREIGVSVEIIWGRDSNDEETDAESREFEQWFIENCGARMIQCKKRPKRHLSWLGNWGYRWEKKHPEQFSDDPYRQTYNAVIDTQNKAGLYFCKAYYLWVYALGRRLS